MSTASKQQIRALRVIDHLREDAYASGDLFSCSRNWPATHHALVRRGLVVATFDPQAPEDVAWHYELTDAGRAALEGASHVSE